MRSAIIACAAFIGTQAIGVDVDADRYNYGLGSSRGYSGNRGYGGYGLNRGYGGYRSYETPVRRNIYS